MTDARLTKAKRVRKRVEFVTAQRRNRAQRSRHFTLLFHRRQDDEGARLGIVASRRIGNAVVRNRAKRLTREWFRHASATLRAGDWIVILKRGAHLCPQPELAAELDRAAQKLTRR